MKSATLIAHLAIGSLLLPCGLHAAAIQFGPVTHYTNIVDGVRLGVAGVRTGDFNGDGHMDMVTVGDRVAVWMNNGAAGFTVLSNHPALEIPRVVAVADLNNDNRPDLLTANYSGYGALSAFLGNGNGTFNRVDTAFNVNDGMPGLAVGDFNGDGKADAAFASSGLTILLGTGNGRFTTFTNYPGSKAYAVAVADFNGDHKLDVVTANYSSSSMSVYIGNGNGTFAAPTHYSGDFSEYHYAVAVGDFNGDGKPDLVTVNYYDSSTSVRLNNGDGTFGAETKYKVVFGPRSVVVGDFNDDGNLDIVAGANSTNALAILLGDGTGMFGAALTNFGGLFGSHQSVSVADFDGDGRVDLATTRSEYQAVTVRLNQTAALLRLEPLSSQVRLKWPNWSGYLLESSTNLLDTNSWITVTNIPAIVGNQKVLTNSSIGDTQFYRVRKPLP